ncbi:MAG: hypothetical protein OXF74_07975 [Rhodobacteraceae bacterium]|nr:hypothetical protein [Paracoccaceae bacterium]
MTADTEGLPVTVTVHRADIQDRDAGVEVTMDLLKMAPEISYA